MTERIVVTGATGFIGSRLVPVLLRRGYAVTCLVRSPAKAADLARQGATLVPGDVTERSSLVEPLRDAAALFHLADWYALGNLDKAKMRAINVDGARHALEVAAELGVPKIIHTSTVGVFGNTQARSLAKPTGWARTTWPQTMSAPNGPPTMRWPCLCSKGARRSSSCSPAA